MKQSLLVLIRFYRRFLSFDTGLLRWLFPSIRTCRFSPTCSEYTYQQITNHGTITGLARGLRQILNCKFQIRRYG